MDLQPQIQRMVTKATSVRALCLGTMIVTLCIMVFVNPAPEWSKLFEAVLLLILGNYVRGNPTPPPTPPGGVA